MCMLAFLRTVSPDRNRRSGEPLPLDRAIRLALAHSTTSAIADADVQRAFASLSRSPQQLHPATHSSVQVLAGPTDSRSRSKGRLRHWSMSWHRARCSIPSASQFLKAAKIEWHASEIQDKDQRNAVIQDVALTYAELAKWEARLERLQQDETDARQDGKSRHRARAGRSRQRR